MTIVSIGNEYEPVRAVSRDLYRDIHKGIRAELFRVTEEAGRLDPGDPEDRGALAEDIRNLTVVLTRHAAHEDAGVQPVLEEQLPELAARIASDHVHLERRVAALAALADTFAGGEPADHREQVRCAYLELAAFTSVYLAHQDLEERVVMPRLEAVVGAEGMAAIHEAVLGALPPADMARTLPLMLPALNVEDRSELLGAIHASAPAEAFERVWGLARSVLAPADLAIAARRLGVD